MEIKPTYVTFEQAKKLKEKGWNQRTEMVHLFTPLKNILREIDINLSIVENELNAPEQWMVIEWLRVNYKLYILALPTIHGYYAYKIIDVQMNPEKEIERLPYKDVDGTDYRTPQEVISAAIDYVLENLIP